MRDPNRGRSYSAHYKPRKNFHDIGPGRGVDHACAAARFGPSSARSRDWAETTGLPPIIDVSTLAGRGSESRAGQRHLFEIGGAFGLILPLARSAR